MRETTENSAEEVKLPSLEERKLPEFNAMQRVKRRLFAMRNGDLAQQMTDLGAKYRINFGLNLPQISEIARDFLPGGVERETLPDDIDMADFSRRLRDNVSTRESMLIAPMLFPVEQLTEAEALAWARSVANPEIADVLCLKLLRNYVEASRLVEVLIEDELDLSRYVALRLAFNLLQLGKILPEKLLPIVEKEEKSGCKMTASLCRQLRDEIDFLMEE